MHLNFARANIIIAPARNNYAIFEIKFITGIANIGLNFGRNGAFDLDAAMRLSRALEDKFNLRPVGGAAIERNGRSARCSDQV